MSSGIFPDSERFHRVFAFTILAGIWIAALAVASAAVKDDPAGGYEFARAEHQARKAGFCTIRRNPDGTSTVSSYEVQQVAEGRK